MDYEFVKIYTHRTVFSAISLNSAAKTTIRTTWTVYAEAKGKSYTTMSIYKRLSIHLSSTVICSIMKPMVVNIKVILIHKSIMSRHYLPDPEVASM